MSSLFDSLGGELREFFAPLVEAAADPDRLADLLSTLGSAPDDPVGAPLASAAGAVSEVLQEIEGLAGTESPSIADIGALLESARHGFAALQALEASGVDAPAGLAGLGKDLTDLLTGAYIAGKSLLLYRLAVLLTLVDAPQDIAGTAPVMSGGTVVRQAVYVPRFHPDNASALIRDPLATLKSAYLTPLVTDADANTMADNLFPRIRDLLRAVNVMCKYGVTPEELALLGDGAPWVDHDLTVWAAEEIAGATADAGATFALSPAARGDLGLIISPFGTVQLETQAGAWAIKLAVTAEVDAVAIGRRGTVLAASADTTSVDATFSATLPPPQDGGPAFVFGTATSSRLEVGGASLTIELDVDHETFLASLAADVANSALVLAPGDGDSFLQEVLPRDGVKVPFALGMTWSSRAGLAFRGSGSLAAAIPINAGIGSTLRVTTIYVQLLVDDTGAIAAELALALSIRLGPVAAVADRVGLLAAVTFPESGGNLGNADLALRFAPPTGIGVAVDGGIVSGGGFLEHTADQYAGVLDLAVCGYAVKAFGLVQTTLPTGQPGYSFVAVISVEFVPGINLPYDFTLDGVGGFIGVHRTISVDAVEQALWAHHLDGLLFPVDPVAAAPQLISALGSYFPAAEDRYVFGPLAKIGWADDIVTGEAALLLELPEPIKLLLIGDVQVGVPSSDPQLVLHISFDGGVDMGKQLAFFDATLHDSRLESYPISGDLAFRYSWGDPAVFALALGGFNPQFQPPAGFPTLKRLAISIHSSVARIEAQSYLALTSNTLQFGARVELTAGTGTFNVHGWLGFDALCERNPLAFEFALTAGVDLRAGTDVIASVHLDGKLSGPTPWHIAGNASLSLLFFDVTVHFDKTWGSTATALPAPDPVPALTAALADSSSWTGVLPVTARAAITPVGSPTDAGDAVLFDPASTLRITQRVVPLDQPISRFAGTPLGQSMTLTLDSLTAFGNTTAPSGTTSAEFAPAQFLELTDAEKLSLPSFSAFDAGVELGGDAVDLGASSRTRAVITPISYVTTTLDSRTDPLPPGSYRPSVSAVLALNDNAGSPQPGVGRYTPPVGAPPRVTLTADQWTIASTSDLTIRSDIPCDGSKLNAHLALNQYLAAHPDETDELQLVLTQEAA